MSRRVFARTRPAPARAVAFLAVVLAGALFPGAPTAEPRPAIPESGDVQVLPLSSDLRVRVDGGREVQLEIRVIEGDDYATIAGRVAGGKEQAAAIAAWNDEARPVLGRWVRLPLQLLSNDHRRLVLRHLFPDDREDGEDWIHRVRTGPLRTYDENLWQVALWFTGRGADFAELMDVNGLSSPELRAGQPIRIPARLLHPAFRTRLRSDDNALVYDADAEGPYAGYDLKAGEALYSAVVVRFTGRTDAEDVISLAEQLRARSGIRDLTDIPVGYRIKIPLDVLEPQFLPAEHPRRLEAEAARAELTRELARRPVGETSGRLKGVLIILDPGHGGRDLGTMNNGIWEHDYVYDVTCRLKRLLEDETAATVVLTLEDRQTGFRPSETDKLKANRQGTILTRPPFLAREEGEARIGVNLRWYLSNSIYRKAVASGTSADRVVFLSLHADSRHASLRGVMVYTPGSAYRTKTYGSNSATYRKYAEVREKPQIRFAKRDRLRSEAVSGKLAAAIVQAFREEELPVQPYQPIRNRIIRGRGKWVPAVLRGNAVPNKVLVEMVNLSNAEDAALLARARERERLARGLLRSLFLYFGEPPPDGLVARRDR